MKRICHLRLWSIWNRWTAARVTFSVSIGLLAALSARADEPRAFVATTPITVSTFGAKGDGVADDTVAIENAVRAAMNLPHPPCVTFPAGVYKVTATILISSRGVCLQGATPWNTVIDSAISGPIFGLGAFSATQSPPWTGTASLFTISNLTLENSEQINVAYTGSRMTIGIQTNGSGHIVMDNMQFVGLKYGFAAPYGSDFDRFKNIWLHENDVGLYMGPSSQQFSIIAIEGALNGEAVVFDGSGQGALSDSSFEDNMTADITFERVEPTRFGWSPTNISAYDAQSNIVVSHNWFETGSGNPGINNWQEYRRVLFLASAGLSSYPRNVQIRDSFLVLGETGIAPKDSKVHSFVELDSGKFITVNNVEVVGDRRDCEIYGSAAAAVTATNILVDDGFNPSIPIFQFTSGTYLTNNFSYTPSFQDTSTTASIPSSCYSGSQFWYDTTLNNWLGCIKGSYSYLAQLDNSLRLPNSVNTLNPSWNSATVYGDKSTLNAIQAAIYAGDASSNSGKWWFQNGGNPVSSLSLQGFAPNAASASVVLNPGAGLSGGASSVGSVKAGAFIGGGVSFASLGTPGPGVWVWCTDCKVAAACAGGGGGAFAFRTAAGTWNCPF